MIEIPLKRPELFDKLGIAPPKGVLMHGPIRYRKNITS